MQDSRASARLARAVSDTARPDHSLRLAVIVFAACIASTSCHSAYQPEPLDAQAALVHLDEPVKMPDVPPHPPTLTWQSSRAEPAPHAPIRLRLEQAQAIAVLRHPRLVRMRAARGLADAADVRADTRPDPELSLSLLWIDPQSVLGFVSSLSWELLPPGTRDARRGLAGALRRSIDADLGGEEWRIAQDARVAWLELVRCVRALALAERAREMAHETREFGRRMLERGASTDLEMTVLEVDAGEAEREVVSRRGAVAVSRERLARALGLPPGAELETIAEADPLEPLEPRIPLGDSDVALLARMPELGAARASYDLAERELELAELGALPKITVGPDIQQDAESFYAGGGFTSTIPLHDKNRAAIAEAKARRRIASAAFEEALFSARAALAEARAEEDAAARALAFHETVVLPRGREALNAAERASSAGVADLLSVLLARERALAAERIALDLRAAHALSVARLEAAFGPEPLVEARTQEAEQR